MSVRDEIETRETRRERRNRILSWLGAAVVGGIAGGVVFGAGIRIAMRVAALTEGLEPEFTVGGSIGLMVFGGFVGLVFGPIVLGVGDRLGRSRRVSAMAVAVAIMLPLFVLATGAEFIEVGLVWLNLITFGGAMAAFGATAAGIATRLQRQPDRAVRLGAGVAYGAGVGAAFAAPILPVALWLFDRMDGGAPHTQISWAREARIGNVGELFAVAAQAALQAAVIGALLGLVYVLTRSPLRRTDHPGLAFGMALAAPVAAILILSGGKALGPPVAVAALMSGLLIGFGLRLSSLVEGVRPGR